MVDKLNYVQDHFKGYNVFVEFITNTGIAIGLLLVVYIILIGVYYLMREYKLFINKANARYDKIPVESLEHYQLLNNNYKSLSEKYKSLSTRNDIIITDLENLENTILDKERSINSLKLSCLYVFENFLKAYPYSAINESNKDDVITNFNDVFRSINRGLNNEDLVDPIINVLNYLNSKDKKVLVYFESRYLDYLSLNHSVNFEEEIKFKNKYEIIDTEVAGFSNDTLVKMDILSLILGLSGKEPNEEVSKLGLIVYPRLFEY